MQLFIFVHILNEDKLKSETSEITVKCIYQFYEMANNVCSYKKSILLNVSCNSFFFLNILVFSDFRMVTPACRHDLLLYLLHLAKIFFILIL